MTMTGPRIWFDTGPWLGTRGSANSLFHTVIESKKGWKQEGAAAVARALGQKRGTKGKRGFQAKQYVTHTVKRV